MRARRIKNADTEFTNIKSEDAIATGSTKIPLPANGKTIHDIEQEIKEVEELLDTNSTTLPSETKEKEIQILRDKLRTLKEQRVMVRNHNIQTAIVALVVFIPLILLLYATGLLDRFVLKEY